MPFFPPFATGFRTGDLVYGLDKARRVYARRYAFFHASRSAINISTIDQYAATDLESTLQKMFCRAIPANQDDFRKALATHEKYRVIKMAEGFCSKGEASHSDKVFGRKCKAGLFWASQFCPDMRVHFILDGLSLDQVVNKSHPHDAQGRAITGVELRWVYRNRMNIHVQETIQFWLNGVPVLAPWVTNASLWERYRPSHQGAD